MSRFEIFVSLVVNTVLIVVTLAVLFLGFEETMRVFNEYAWIFVHASAALLVAWHLFKLFVASRREY